MNRLRALRTANDGQGGAAAVEFALVLLILVPLLLGMIEFGRAYNAQIQLTAAAREGARIMALQNDAGAARSATRNAAPSLDPPLTDGQIAIVSSPCAVGDPVTVTATYNLDFFTSFFANGVTLTGQGVMRCGG